MEIGYRKTAITRYQIWTFHDVFGEQLPHDLVAVVHIVERCGDLIGGTSGDAGLEHAVQAYIDTRGFADRGSFTEADDATGFVKAHHDNVGGAISAELEDVVGR